MELFGSNARFGRERVEVSETRCVLPVVQDEKRFPQGVGGLLPVVTQKKKGGEKTSYAFWVGAPETPAAEAAAAPEGVAEAIAEAAAAPEEIAADAPGSAPDAASAQALEAAVALVNRMLAQAAQLSGYSFGQVGGIEVGVTERGWGFTRVEMVPLDAHGQPSAAPLHLHVETCDEPGAPGSLGSVIEYDAAGEPRRMVLTEFGDNRSCRVLVTPNEKTGKFSVAKVEETFGRDRNVRLLYKRGWQPKEDGGADGKPARAGAGRAPSRGGDRRWDGPRDRDDWRRDDRRRDDRGSAARGSSDRRWDDCGDSRPGRPDDRRPGDRGGRGDFSRGDRGPDARRW